MPVEISPLRPGALQLSVSAALAAIDQMLRPARAAAQPVRHHIETSRAPVIDQILGVLGYALEPVIPVEFEVGQIEYNPQFLQIATAADAVVIGEFLATAARPAR